MESVCVPNDAGYFILQAQEAEGMCVLCDSTVLPLHASAKRQGILAFA